MVRRRFITHFPDGTPDIIDVSYPGDNICVNHIDGDPTNNHPDNLQFVDMRENRSARRLLSNP